ncbi:hypothetical protein ITJ66_13970 [Plantibacter sp. VKM Ac-2885]|uniref:Uncharacterized protein n=2 Tax=Plantibacter cousiniae (nom. nud.) TaxID=199709 RepID=A0ABY1LND6_9MICO|nr:hypothetical protein [Plantibacter sp. VKM Ac-2885]MBF4513592.1 hypothetical protein [Plantibacter sp. VKM Ac-2885]SKC68153.1 hypothetical protein SAMN06295973_2786 [Plantibacter cousiniae]
MDTIPDEMTTDARAEAPPGRRSRSLGRRSIMAIVVAVVAQLSVFALVIVACTGQVGEPRGDRASTVPEAPAIDPSAPQRDDELPTRDEVFAVAADLLGQMVNTATGGQPFAFSPQASEAPCSSLAPSGRATKLARMAVEVELPVGTSRAVLVDLINGYAPPLELAADSDEFRSELIVPSPGELELSAQLRDDAIIFERELRPDADVLRITVENGCFLPPIE